MIVEFQPAAEADLAFARTLARRTMMPYYTRHGLLWRDSDFDDGWGWRENYMLHHQEELLGFVSLSVDTRALYIRELHLLESARGRGVGSAVLDRMLALAARRHLGLLRLMVFKDNPAQRLYARKGLQVVGEDPCFWRMQKRVEAPGSVLSL
ncbi:GNAT family N-acetyltransferase [Pseudomonas japonica]|uniref:GNAT family N-acetyltransferase n=1 Tax=Pseudomonas japonica TaxID=256466 RepID=UPI0015E2A8C7|nr:GNAT family N-acetyltransferase [Pseudomonas japonica]MBA1288541.1 GNAT family N-acetyltransferase [Pseudomonas japonica]